MNIENLIKANKEMAEGLLEEFSEFYPFAYGQNALSEVRNIAGLTESDTPTSLELVEELEKVLNIAIKSNDFRAVSICLDVRIIPDGETEKSDALNIRVNTADGDLLDLFLPYKLINGNVEFGNLEEYLGAKFVTF